MKVIVEANKVVLITSDGKTHKLDTLEVSELIASLAMAQSTALVAEEERWLGLLRVTAEPIKSKAVPPPLPDTFPPPKSVMGVRLPSLKIPKKF